MISLQARLNFGLATILAVVFASQWLLGSYAIRQVVEHEMITRLEHDGDTLLASLTAAAGPARFDAERLGLVYGQAYSGHYFVLHAAGQEYRSASLADATILAVPLPPGETRRYHCDGPKSQPLLALVRGFSKDGVTVSLTMAEELTAIEREIDELSLGYLALTLAVLLVAVLLQSLDVARSLRPLSAMRRELAALGRGERARIECRVPTEIKPLVDELNRLLAVVERRLQQSRAAVGNLAHALKTPLAMLFRVADDPGLRDFPGLAGPLREQTAAIHRRIERELKKARLAGTGGTARFFSPAEELPALVRVLDAVYSGKGLDIQVKVPQCQVRCDREDLLELIGNLADNACKWAASRVSIRIECGDGMVLEVADDGPGCPEASRAALLERGTRLDESVPGHGLGLAIVRDIADFYGGWVDMALSPELGGLAVVVRLPDIACAS